MSVRGCLVRKIIQTAIKTGSVTSVPGNTMGLANDHPSQLQEKRPTAPKKQMSTKHADTSNHQFPTSIPESELQGHLQDILYILKNHGFRSIFSYIYSPYFDWKKQRFPLKISPYIPVKANAMMLASSEAWMDAGTRLRLPESPVVSKAPRWKGATIGNRDHGATMT